ncbi:mandelate racemase/muconate lactonizing enzyme family protein [Thermasporomyces composti]|uniref:Dipeptide epimerase n=1 Tax=Thermasporomyces composti TaxID=696763 RepID=A0A3D9VL60_THECX|nr:dipeptide epimerase [Thermasporomyces composti]REF38121.1 L-alanine-DL-glutamate epimerase-like enolase superfamily enzyme [Thermasporomyces composti]
MERPKRQVTSAGVSRITEVRCHPVSAPLHTPFVTALRRATTSESLLVEVLDDDGNSGWGEAPEVWRVTGESMAGAQACVMGPLRDALVGADPDDLTRLLRAVHTSVVGNHNAKAAVDVALHDLAARRLGIPLVRLLGGTSRRVLTDVTLSAGEPDELAEAARARLEEGFTVLKVKVGQRTAAGARADVARVRAVRDAVGPDALIRIDANQGWTPREAVRVIHALEDADLDVELVEQPVAAADLDGLAFVSDRVTTPILADEAVYGARDLVEVIRRRAADLVNVKLGKCGGIGPARTLLDLAEAHGMGTLIGSMVEGPIGVGAAASLAAACGTTLVSDLDAAWWLAESPVEGGMRYEGPEVVLPDAPGLGVTGLR